MIKFVIKNFQSIEDATIRLDQFTSITGATDRGKSATVRAIRAVLYNDWSPSYLRLGAKECTIQCYLPEPYPDGIVYFELIKGAKKNQYNIHYEDGTTKEFPKVGVDTPQEIKDLGFAPIQSTRDEKFNLNIQSQLEGLFLLTAPEVSVTSLFNTVFQIEKYEIALKNINKAIMQMNRDWNSKDEEVIQKKANLEGIERELISKKTRYETLITFKENLDKLQSDFNSLETLSNQTLTSTALLITNSNSLKAIHSIEGVLVRLEEIETLFTPLETYKFLNSNREFS